MAEKTPEYVDLSEILQNLGSSEDRSLLRTLVEEGKIPSVKFAGNTLVNEIDALNILLKSKALTGTVTGKGSIRPKESHNFQNDLKDVLRLATDEELFAFGKSVLVKQVANEDFTIDYVTSSADKTFIIDAVEDQFRKIGSDIFERGLKPYKTYRDILYICARKLKGVPYYKDADILEQIPKPYPDTAVAEGINPRKLVHVDAMPTDYMEFVITEKLIEIIWDGMTPENRRTLLKSIIGELSDFDNLKDTDKDLLKGELTRLLNSEKGVDKEAIKSIIPLLAISAGQISGFGAYIFATTAAATLAGAIGITLPFAFYTALTTGLSFLLGPVGMVAAGLFAGAVIMKPNYRRLYPAISVIAQIRNRQKRRLI